MKPISIEKRDQLSEAIKTVEGRASARTITADDIIDALAEVDKRLALISTKKDAIGTIAHIDVNAQRFPNAYKYAPESTQFDAELKRDGWRITNIFRGITHGPTGRIVLDFTEATKAHLEERLRIF